MLTWPAKDPDERLDYTRSWAAELGADTIASSIWIPEVAAGIAIAADSFLPKSTSIIVTGGTSGLSAVLTNRITTVLGNVHESVIKLPIQAKYPAATAPVRPTNYRDILLARLSSAEDAYHSLVIGGQAKVYVDQNGERVEYQQGSARSLLGYINTLKYQLGLGSGSGPLNVWL